jgi:hypothetical protein
MDRNDHLHRSSRSHSIPFDHKIVSLECYSACWTLMAMTIKRPKHSTSAIHACNPVIMQNLARHHQFLHRILSDSNSSWSHGSMPRSRLQSLLSLATSRDSSTHGKSTHGKSDGVISTHDMHYNDQQNYLSQQTSFALTQSQSRPSMTISNTTNYVWDRSFSSKTVIHPR